MVATASENIVVAGLDAMWLILTAIGILLTQVGFACIEGGHARRKDQKTVLFKNLMDHSVASSCWYFVGWRIFTGFNSTAIGEADFTYGRILQQFGFEITTSSIVSACIIGRCRLNTYLCFSAYLAAFVYPVIAYVCWNPNGPLALFGYKDFGGGGVVHLLAGTCGLLGSHLCGKRYGVGTPSSGAAPLTAIGGLVLYISWFFVNAGSSGSISTENAIRQANRAALNTGLGAGAASLMGFIICKLKKRLNLDFLVNSLISGLIINTAPCGFIEPPVAILLGLTAPWVVTSVSDLLAKMNVEDALDAIGVHGVCGFVGTIAVGLFHSTDGLLYSWEPRLLIAQVMACLVIISWSCCTSLPFFSLFKYMDRLTYSENEQVAGLDHVYFGDYLGKDGEAGAYPESLSKLESETR